MFSSSGYFRGVNCPFYAHSLCERPHCHFRHARVEEKPSNTNRAENGPSYSTSGVQPYTPPEIASYSTTSPSQTLGPVEAYQTASSNGESGINICPIPAFSESVKNLPEPDEIPVDFRALPKISGLPKPKAGSPRGSKLPSYQPTPKGHVQLIVKGNVPSYKPTPKDSLSDSKSTSSHRIEYDPVKNYAFKEKSRSDEDEEEHRKLRNSNGFHQQLENNPEGRFSDDEDTAGEATKQKTADDDLTDSDEDVSHNNNNDISEIGSERGKTKLPNYAQLLTPSSYFTSKLTSDLDHGTNRKRSIDSDSSSTKLDSSSKHRSSNSKSSHNHHSSKSGLKSKHHSNSGETHNRSASSSKSSSSSSKPSGIKPQSSHHKTDSSSDKKKSSSSSSSAKDKSKPSSSSHLKSSHIDTQKSKSHDSSVKSKPSHSSNSNPVLSSLTEGRSNSSTSEKENKHSFGHSSSKNSESKSLSVSSSKTEDSSHKRKHSDSSHHKSSSSKTSSSHHNGAENLLKKFKDRDGSHTHSVAKYGSSSDTSKLKIKSERKDSSSSENSKHQSREQKTHSSKKSSNQSSELKDKQEKKIRTQQNVKNEHDKNRKGSTERRKSVTERRISDITSNLFGDESGASGSDSDVQIVEVPPPPVYELSDSDNNHSDNDVDGEEVSSSDWRESADLLSDSDTFDECLRIFQENERQLAAKIKRQKLNPVQVKKEEGQKTSGESENQLVSQSKKRMAHKGADQVKRSVKAPTTMRPRLSPAEVMHNRIVEMQKRALLRAARREGRESELPSEFSSDNSAASSKLPAKTLTSAAASLISNQKKREAHTPNLATPTKAPSTSSSSSVWSPNSFYNKRKKNTNPSTTAENSGKNEKLVTIATTASKTEKRKAHEPTQVNLKRPIIPVEFGAKVPTNVRQRYLNLIIDEYLKFNKEDIAFSKGQEEEQNVYKRASNKNIYLRVAVNAIKRIRMEAAESQPSSSKKTCQGVSSLSALSATPHPTQSHAATLGGSWAAKTSFTLNRSTSSSYRQPQTFKGADLYEMLKKYILTEDQLRENGFPRPAEDGSSKAVFYKKEARDSLLKENERTCRRCGKRFYVDKDGNITTPEVCIYHYANPYKKKVAGSIDSRYGCCNEKAGSKGCQVGKCHVHDRNKEVNLTGYMRTMPASPSSDKNHGVYSLDCEMVYTKMGLELARVTVVGEDNSSVYETLVKPDSEIIDYNTRFSGITEKDMKGVTTTLRGVQAVMLSMISDKTILIGHSLESDLTALKIIHSTVVDTSIVFPHRLGLPYKRALRHLMVELLQKIIQADDGGHDSKEDAVACMQLMMYKVKEDAKKLVRRV